MMDIEKIKSRIEELSSTLKSFNLDSLLLISIMSSEKEMKYITKIFRDLI